MDTKRVLPLMLTVGITFGAVSPSFAGQFQQNHPRRAEVLRRDRNLGGAINRDRGQLGGNYNGLKTEQRGIRQQEQADARANGGFITSQQKQQLNGEENTLRSQVSQDYTGQGGALGTGYGRGGNGGWGGHAGGGNFAQNHPRRAEVLGRDNNLNNSINQDRGQLGGNYSALKTDDRSIRQQEQADSRANGGYITQQQKQQLNGEENQLRQQIGQDYSGNRY
ncbi:MAG: hypothetical protein P4L53_26200 [Candidatus Obscuribacterales bacterium]|nr:hypothetical protein [Candidatus Obscuribacterales bacterium]